MSDLLDWNGIPIRVGSMVLHAASEGQLTLSEVVDVAPFTAERHRWVYDTPDGKWEPLAKGRSEYYESQEWKVRVRPVDRSYLFPQGNYRSTSRTLCSKSTPYAFNSLTVFSEWNRVKVEE